MRVVKGQRAGSVQEINAPAHLQRRRLMPDASRPWQKAVKEGTSVICMILTYTLSREPTMMIKNLKSNPVRCSSGVGFGMSSLSIIINKLIRTRYVLVSHSSLRHYCDCASAFLQRPAFR